MSSVPSAGIPSAPVSWGELLDKITILEVKRERISSEAALAHVLRELALLRDVARPVLGSGSVPRLLARLKSINARLWNVEDRIRLKEAAAQFDEEFIRLARAVYRTNDVRAAVKRRINAALRSELVEQKSYAGGRSAAGRRRNRQD
jgi:Family of unknown function (DUF6165)